MRWPFTKEKPALPPDPGAALVRLREDFREAAGGIFCRTLTFTRKVDEDGQQAKQEWLEAAHVPLEGWRILRKTGVAEVDAAYHEIFAQGLDFIGAIEKMTTYENALMFLGDVAYDPQEEGALGADYFRTFAKKEALVFDDNGNLHPTLQGHIVTPGSFPLGAQKQALAAWAARSRGSSVALVKNDQALSQGNAVAGFLLPAAVNTQGTAASTDINAILNAQEIMASLRFLRDIVVTAKKKGWHVQSDRPGKYGYFDGATCGSMFTVTVCKDIPDSKIRIEKCLRTIAGAQNESNNLQKSCLKALDLFHVAIISECARFLKSNIGKKLKGREYVYQNEDLNFVLSVLAEKMRDLGWAEATPDSKLIDRMIKDEGRDCLAQVDEIIAWFESTLAPYLPPPVQKTQRRGLKYGVF